VTLNFKF